MDHVFYNVPSDVQIIYCHGPTPQPIFSEFTDKVRFVKGAEADFMNKEDLSKMRNVLLILDDCYQEIAKQNKDLIRWIFCTLNHHANNSCLLLLHHMYSQTIPHLRETMLNTNFFCFTNSVANKSMLRTWCMQYYPEKWKSVLSILDHVFSQSRFGYVNFDFSPFKDDRFRISTYLTPEEGQGHRLFFLFKDS